MKIKNIFKTIGYIFIITLCGGWLAIAIPIAMLKMIANKYGWFFVLVIGAVIGAVIGCGFLIMFFVWERERIVAERERIKKMNERNAEEVKRRAQARRQEQQEYRNQMIVYGDGALSSFESIPEYLSVAEKYLDQAENNFNDSAFVPFWDSIKETAKALARYDKCIRSINDNLSYYTKLIKEHENAPPKFPLSHQSVAKLNIGTAISKRMQAIVRKAHCNFQFASIYQQYKTNQILVAGFTNLASALDDMTWNITESINNLSSSVDTMTSGIEAIHSQIGDIHEELSGEARERASKEEKVLEMLDDIRRGRKPLL